MLLVAPSAARHRVLGRQPLSASAGGSSHTEFDYSIGLAADSRVDDRRAQSPPKASARQFAHIAHRVGSLWLMATVKRQKCSLPQLAGQLITYKARRHLCLISSNVLFVGKCAATSRYSQIEPTCRECDQRNVTRCSSTALARLRCLACERLPLDVHSVAWALPSSSDRGWPERVARISRLLPVRQIRQPFPRDTVLTVTRNSIVNVDTGKAAVDIGRSDRCR